LASKILKCPICNNYTLKDTCKSCNAKAVSPKPQKYSVGDKYASYRIKYKKELGLIK